MKREEWRVKRKEGRYKIFLTIFIEKVAESWWIGNKGVYLQL